MENPIYMKFLLRVQGENVWNTVKFSREPSLKLGWIGELKPKYEWDKVDNEGSEANVWVFSNIFNRVGLD